LFNTAYCFGNAPFFVRGIFYQSRLNRKFSNSNGNQFRSFSPYAGGSDYAWGVVFGFGGSGYDDKDVTIMFGWYGSGQCFFLLFWLLIF
jgi:hypothetical protein